MSFTRRDFLATTGAVAALGATRSVFAAEGDAANGDASDIRVACIGFKGRGQGHISSFSKNLVALCDVDESVLSKAADSFQEKHGRKLDTYVDFRKLLEREDINAVSIATPNHTHALISVAAMQAGKDVYCEKPISHDVWEGRQVVAAARQHDKIVQCGTQARSSRALQEAAKWVRDGGLGKIEYVVGTCYKPRPSIGKRTEPLTIPSSIHYDLWCGPAEKHDIFRNSLHYDWHWDWNTGNGDMGNQGIHQMDVARWFLGVDSLAPRVISIGGRLGYDDAGDTPNTQVVYHDYPDAPLIFETRGLPRSKEGQENWGRSMDSYRGTQIGVIVQCENGHLNLGNSYRQAMAYDRAGNLVKRWDGGGDHFQNWINAVAARDSGQLNAEIREGHLSSALCHTGGVSQQLGKTARAGEISEQLAGNDLLFSAYDRMASHLRANGVDIDSRRSDSHLTLGPWLELDTTTELFTNSDEANALAKRTGRAPFVVPQVEQMTKTAARTG